MAIRKTKTGDTSPWDPQPGRVAERIAAADAQRDQALAELDNPRLSTWTWDARIAVEQGRDLPERLRPFYRLPDRSAAGGDGIGQRGDRAGLWQVTVMGGDDDRRVTADDLHAAAVAAAEGEYQHQAAAVQRQHRSAVDLVTAGNCPVCGQEWFDPWGSSDRTTVDHHEHQAAGVWWTWVSCGRCAAGVADELDRRATAPVATAVAAFVDQLHPQTPPYATWVGVTDPGPLPRA